MSFTERMQVTDESAGDNARVRKVRLEDADGNPIDIGGGGGPIAISDVAGLQDALDDLQAQIDALNGGGDN